MSEGQCPACGAPVRFTAGSAQVVVCGHCRTVVARKGAAFEARGQVAALAETDTPLQMGLVGRYGGEGFTVVGHLQKDFGAGPWDEWYLELDGGRSAWLAESEGALALMFDAGRLEQPFRAFSPGGGFTFRDQPFVTEEARTFRVTAAEGQLPRDLEPARPARYVDATGPQGIFLSLEFDDGGDAADAFVGRAVRLEELGIPPDTLRARHRQVSLAQARCTQCNGPLELRAPDRTKRVACPYCGALLDVSQGKLSFLQALEKPDFEPTVPLGAKGTLRGAEWTCIGFLRRACYVEGTKYVWQEYLLYHRARGFAWLMESDGHWSFLTPIPAGEVTAGHIFAKYQGRSYKVFQRVEAVTEYVLGEVYWEITRGEKASAAEYVAPPFSLNEERTPDEVTWTLSEYLEPEEVGGAFGLKGLRRPTGIAPSQPNPYRARLRERWTWAGVYSVALLALFIVLNVISADEKVLDETVTLPASVAPNTPEAMHFSAPFEIHRRGNLRVDYHAWPLANDWLGVQGDLVNQDSGEVVSFYVEASYYSGQDSDGAWTEGSTTATEYLSAVPPGRYVLRLTPATDKPAGRAYQVTLTSDVPRALWFVLALLALYVFPVFTSFRAATFESRRWSESNLSAPRT